MLTSFPAPVLSVTADAVKDLEGHDALSGLWTLFTKCKESLQDGRRLENISWRLWHRELVQAQLHSRASESSTPVVYQPLTPVSVTPNQPDDLRHSSPPPSKLPDAALGPNNLVTAAATATTANVVLLSRPQRHPKSPLPAAAPNDISVLGLPSPVTDGDRDQAPFADKPEGFPLMLNAASATATAVAMAGLAANRPPSRSAKPHCVGKIIVDMLPNHLDIPKLRHTTSTSKQYGQPPPSPAPSDAPHAPRGQFITPVLPSLPATYDHAPFQPASHFSSLPPTLTPSSISQLAPSASHTYASSQVPSIQTTVTKIDREQQDSVHSQIPPLVTLPSAPPSTATITAVTTSMSMSTPSLTDQANSGTVTTTTITTTMSANPFPRVVIVNPTPHPTPPMTPVLGGTATLLESRASKSTHLLPPVPLPGPALLTVGASTGVRTYVQVQRNIVPEQAQSQTEAADPPSSIANCLSPSPSLHPAPPRASAAVAPTSSSPSLTAPLSPDITTTVANPEAAARTPGDMRRFFLQQSPDDISPDQDRTARNDHQATGQQNQDARSPVRGSNPETALSGGEDVIGKQKGADLRRRQRSRQGRQARNTSAHTKKGAEKERAEWDDVGEEDEDEDEDEDDHDKRSVSAVTHTTGTRARKGKGKEVGIGAGKNSLARLRRTHSAKPASTGHHGHVAPMMHKRSSTHDEKHSRQQHKATFNIGSASSGGSKSTQSTNALVHMQQLQDTQEQADDDTFVQAPTVMPSLTDDVPAKPSIPAPAPSVTSIAADTVTNRNAAQVNTKASEGNGANPPLNTNCNSSQVNGTQQGRKTIVVASTSEEYETTDGTDSEWASEEMDEAEKNRQSRAATRPHQQQLPHPGPPRSKGHSKSAITLKAAEEEGRLREAALEAQRQRELFAKVPRRSYSNLNRTQSGLLSQLMNPNPAIFPPGHPYRATQSSQDITRTGLTMTMTQPQNRRPKQQHVGHAPPRSNSAFAAPVYLSTSKSAVAVPMAAQVTAISSSKPAASNMPSKGDENRNSGNGKGGGGGYRPKGRPQEEEMEDDSGEENEHDQIPVSRSVAQEKLQALISRRPSSSQQRQESKGGDTHAYRNQLMTGMTDFAPGGSTVGLTAAPTSSMMTMTTPTPIPLGHPYNLPAPAPPMTPRTTRRRMLRTELSESMRRQLLWERQVSSTTNPAAAARRTSQQVGGLRPLATTASESASPTQGVGNSRNGPDGNGNPDDERGERRRRVLSRNWTWADDYHFAGW